MKKIFCIVFFLMCLTNISTMLTASPILERYSSNTVSNEGDSLQKPKNWKLTGIVGLNVTQTHLWNWAAGGNSNFNGVIFAKLNLLYTKGRSAWESNLDTELGYLYSTDLDPTWRKSSDKINIATKYGYKLSDMFYLTALAGFKSQYLPAWKYPQHDETLSEPSKISTFLSPSYTDLSIGIDWKWKNIFSIYVSPLAGLITTCTDSILRADYGVPIDKTFAASLGATIKMGVNYTLVKDLKIMSFIQFYTPYTDKEQKFGNFNVDWDFSISYQFLKVLNVKLSTSLKYYEKVKFGEWDNGMDKSRTRIRRVQFCEIFGIGVGYSF